jgi:hypothetical protein
MWTIFILVKMLLGPRAPQTNGLSFIEGDEGMGSNKMDINPRRLEVHP